ncbi:hypothetical protein [Endozoicomonas sp. 8E]|nr:hypothetical protein [Endozoicomonas sp. 8E]WOG26011.1 hypothetical protein P6910_15685 [Endozoicomonas sp. 8E]
MKLKIKLLEVWDNFLTGIVNLPCEEVPDVEPRDEELSKAEIDELEQDF